MPYIEPEPGQQRLRLGAQEFAADLVMGAGGLFQNDDGAALARKRDGKGRTGKAAADHNRFAHRETCSFLVQLFAQNFANITLRQGVAELDNVRHLVVRQALVEKFAQLRLG